MTGGAAGWQRRVPVKFSSNTVASKGENGTNLKSTSFNPKLSVAGMAVAAVVFVVLGLVKFPR